MILGVGIDLVGVARMRDMLAQGFADRFFTSAEQAHVRAGANSAERAAGIFAAKEAMLKALGTGIAGIGLLAVSVAHDALGAPVALLQGEAAQRLAALGGGAMRLSITHSEGVAVAVAIAEGTDAAAWKTEAEP
ncbi:MAG: holo-ACP synthase [Oscillospiraceae bacterium]|jgi:holo-[acyl-carrier protein] synthase|nr:holo-ACP synthase [Oscillospiraceae bacterium]